MNTTVINIKTDPEIKAKAQKLAKKMGISLTTVMNHYLKHFIQTSTITLQADQEEPSEYLLESMKKSEEQLKNGEASPTFTNAKDAVEWLHKQTE